MIRYKIERAGLLTVSTRSAKEPPRMRRQFSSERSLAPLVLGLCIGLLWPAQAFARALIRFVHAVPGVGKATVDIDAGSGLQNVGSIAFGQVTQFKSLRSGSFKWSLKGAQGKVLATGTSTVGDGVYDIVILDKPSGSGVQLAAYKAEGAKAGQSLIRVIHAVPELGSPMFMLDMHTLANRLPYVRATPYFSVMPGAYSFSAMKPWLMKPGDPTLVDVKGVRFAPGVAYSAIVVGSRGQPVRVVRVVDRGAPLTRPVSLVKTVKPGPMGGSMGKASSVVVRPGDSMWAIARRIVGPTASNEEVQKKLVAVWDMNAKRIGTGDPNLVFPGQRLILPS
jgi:nucleoid-associated protein YgaU